MKNLIIVNKDDIVEKVIERDGNTFTIKGVVSGDDVDTFSVAFIEVPVGNHAFGYHYHDQSEEVFYIVSGEGELRTHEGVKNVKAGDICCFPTGEKGAHVLSNTSTTEKLVFIDYDVKVSNIDLVTFPDTNKLMVVGKHIKTMVDLPK